MRYRVYDYDRDCETLDWTRLLLCTRWAVSRDEVTLEKGFIAGTVF